MKKILYAFRFLTILPISWKQNENLVDVARSVIFFPLVGGILGALLSALSYFLLLNFSVLTVAVIVTVLWIFFTGGLHLDGLSDLFDGFGGHTPEARLKIMKDSSIGVFGALALICVILLKIVFISELLGTLETSNYLLLIPIILIPAWSRYFEILAIRFFDSARPDGLGVFFKKDIKNIDWIIPGVVLLGFTAYFASFVAVAAILVSLIVMGLFAKSVSKKLGGLTGDCYGAICELSEVLMLFLLSIKVFV